MEVKQNHKICLLFLYNHQDCFDLVADFESLLEFHAGLPLVAVPTEKRISIDKYLYTK